MTFEDSKKIMHVVAKYLYPKLMCNEACIKFLDVMKIFEIKGRLVGFERPSVNPLQGHFACEILLDDRWVLFDVAFDFANNKSAEDTAKMGLEKHPLWTRADNMYREEVVELYNNRKYYDY